MKICVVTVTYGNRFKYLKQVIEASLKEGAYKVIIVDNSSEKESRNKLEELEEKLKDKIKVVSLKENTGSAGGFKKGLKEAYECKDCEFIWLLDDDNEPQKDSLKVLKEFWQNYYAENKEENLCLLSYRPDRVQYKEAIMTHNPNLVLGRKNSFLGFHIVDLPKKLVKFLKRKIGIKTFKENPNIKYGKVAVAPYGGMFFHKKLIGKIGYPKEEFFVYVDDHEWSYRITKSKGKIILVLDSILDDIESSWYLKSKFSSFFYSYLNNGNNFRVYYSVRNRVIFEQQELVTNKFLYNLHIHLFMLILLFYINNNNKNRYKTFKKAIKDGKNKKMGKLL